MTALIQAAAADHPTTLARLRTLTLDGRSGPLSFDPNGERLTATVTLWRLRGGGSDDAAEHWLAERAGPGPVVRGAPAG